MAEIKILKENGKDIIPVTHEKAVVDDNGVSLKNKLKSLEDSKLELVNVDGTVEDINVKAEDERIGELENLQTENKESIVGALNELFQDVDSGKQLIADAIDDESITKDSTFSAMSEAISKKKVSGKRSLYNELVAKGYGATESMSVEEMVSLLEESNIDPNTVKQIACNSNHTFILKNDGTVWSTGYNFYGQLGLGTNVDKARFNQVDIDNVKQIECGGGHTMLIKNDGSLWGCGYGDSGQLGLDSFHAMKTFTQVTINVNNDAKQVACGNTHTLLLKTDGTLWVCGSPYYGQLGLGSSYDKYSSVYVFIQVPDISDVKQVECYGDFSFILKNDGSLWSCGYNSSGQLGLGDSGSFTDRTSFTQVTTNINNDVKQVICGNTYTFILKKDGSLWSTGANTYGQLGVGDTTNRTTFTQVTTNINNDVKQVSCGNGHTFILKNDGSLWSTGANTYGQLGLGDSGTSTHRNTFTQVGGINNIHQIACGDYHSFVCNNEGLYSCGYNNHGQLGGNESTTFTNRFPIDSIEEYTLKLKLWQFLFNMELPVTGSMSIEEMLEVLVDKGNHLEGALDNVKDTLINLMQKGGYTITGEENINSLLQLLKLSGMSISDIKQIACGSEHTFILKNDDTLWACGNNTYGQLGLGDTTNRTTFTQVTTNINNDVKQVACGGFFTFIIKKDGSLWSCGYNTYGELGLGTSGSTTNKTTFTQVTTNINNDVKQVVCGDSFTIILKTDGSIWSCGKNTNGQLGLNDTNQRTTFTKVTTNVNNDVKQISCSGAFAFIIKNDGSIWACGYNGTYNLGLGDNSARQIFTQVTTNINNDVKQIYCGYYHTFIIKNDGSVWTCGRNNYGQLGLGSSGISTRSTFTQVTYNINNDVKQIACGLAHTFILKNDGTLWSCGYDNRGQLGLGDTTPNRNKFTQVIANINNDVKQIICSGCDYTFILKTDGSIWGCGYNGSGQLGLGDKTNRTTFTQVSRGF